MCPWYCASSPAGMRLEGIHLAQRQIAADGLRLGSMVGGLIVVQVAIPGGRHDDIMPRAGGLDRPANPIHHDGVLGQAALADFAPADQAASLGIDELLDAADEVALQLMLVLQALLLDAGLAAGALLPIVFGHLVAADVDVFAGKQGQDFRQHVLQELEGLILARAIDPGKNAPLGVRRVRPAGAAQFGKRRAAPRWRARAFQSPARP